METFDFQAAELRVVCLKDEAVGEDDAPVGPQQRLHHGAETRQQGLDAGLEAVLGAAAVDILKVGGVLRGGEHDELLLSEVLHPQRLPPRQGMGAVHDGKVRHHDAGLPGKTHPLHYRRLIEAGNGEIQLPGLQPREELVGGHHMVAQLHLRAAAGEVLQIRGLPAGDQGVRHADGKADPLVLIAALRLLHGGGEGAHEPLPALIEVLAGLRQRQMPPAPEKEREAQSPLHPGDGFADSGLGGVEESGGGGKAAELRGLQEKLDLVEGEIRERHIGGSFLTSPFYREGKKFARGKIPNRNPPFRSLALQTGGDLLS